MSNTGVFCRVETKARGLGIVGLVFKKFESKKITKEERIDMKMINYVKTIVLL